MSSYKTFSSTSWQYFINSLKAKLKELDKIPTATSLGRIKANPKTESYTQEVRVSSTGFLYTEPAQLSASTIEKFQNLGMK